MILYYQFSPCTPEIYVETLEVLLDNIPKEPIGRLVWEALIKGRGAQTVAPELAARTC